MKYAVIQTGGKQYKVSEGTEIEVDKLDVATNGNFEFEKVLLYSDNGEVKIGQPNISGAIITAKVLEQKKGKKIRVAKFKAKARYRKVQGHRQMLTRLKIDKISITSKTEAKSKSSSEIKEQKSNLKDSSEK